jgi:hypothetical protein
VLENSLSFTTKMPRIESSFGEWLKFMDKPAIRDVMLRQAFQLAFFIQGDRELAIRIATTAMSKLKTAVIAQDKRLHYKLSRRSWLPGSKSTNSRIKVNLSKLHLPTVRLSRVRAV